MSRRIGPVIDQQALSRPKSPWGATSALDDFTLLRRGMGARCRICDRVTRNEHLDKDKVCPDPACKSRHN